MKSYIDCKEILTKACKELPVLQELIGTDIEKHISHLKQREYFLFVTGTTMIRCIPLSVKLISAGSKLRKWVNLQSVFNYCVVSECLKTTSKNMYNQNWGKLNSEFIIL